MATRRSRRARGEGSLRFRPDRSASPWQGRVTVDGRRHYVYGRSREEVARKLAVLARDLDEGMEPERLTLGAWLERWLRTTVRRSLRPNTYLSYATAVRTTIVPALGHVPLRALRARHVDAMLADCQAAGMAPSTVRRLHGTLSSALSDAVRQRLVQANVARQVRAVRVERPEPRPLSREAARRLLEVASADANAPMYVLALAYGLRRGEVVGLVWYDPARPERGGVDLEGGRILVRQQLQKGRLVPLKRDASRRDLALRPWLVDLLRWHANQLRGRRMLAGAKWREHGLLFPTRYGTPVGESNHNRAWHRLLRRAGLERMPFHTLRHSFATFALAEGASLFDVSRALGHSSISVTANVYGHVSEEGRRAVAEKMERVLRGASGK